MSENSSEEEGAANSMLSWSGKTDPGRFRRNNEDAFLALAMDGRELRYLGSIGEATFKEGDFIFAVSDGLGGANSGDYASRIAVQKITDMMPKSFRLAAMGMESDNGQLLSEIFVRIDREMQEMGEHYEELRGMGATLSLCWFTPDWAHFAHVGDSRIYYLPREGGYKQITDDHSDVGEMLRKGKLNEREARNHPERHILQQALGGQTRSFEPQVGSVKHGPGDRFVLCTDGVTDGLWDRRIDELMRKPPPRFESLNPSERLVKDAIEESGRDNATAVVIEVS